MFLVALVLFSKDPFEPMCLFVSEPLIHERRMVTDEELLAATLTPERPHFRVTRRFLSALPLPYCHSPHLLNFSDCLAFRSFAFCVLAFAAALEAILVDPHLGRFTQFTQSRHEACTFGIALRDAMGFYVSFGWLGQRFIGGRLAVVRFLFMLALEKPSCGQ